MKRERLNPWKKNSISAQPPPKRQPAGSWQYQPPRLGPESPTRAHSRTFKKGFQTELWKRKMIDLRTK
jgi:hypothetical protein